MKKILVIGSGGAGKSTFARRLGEKTGLEVIHLDKLYWKSNWTEPSKEEWRETTKEILRHDEWIIDGNYSGTLDLRIKNADTVIFLDFPPAICVWRVLKRVTFYRKGKRPDLAAGCDEKFDWSFIKHTWNYSKRSKPKVESLLEIYKNKLKVMYLTSTKEVENFFVNYLPNQIESK